MRETWYVMEDGTVGDPREIREHADGVLRHEDGRAVAYASHGPRSRGVDVESVRSKPAPARDPLDHDGDGRKGGSLPSSAREMVAGEDTPASSDREMKPSGNGKGYRTRGGKAG